MFIALLTLFIGSVALWMAFYVFRKVGRDRNWPTVPGEIMERGLGDVVGVENPASYAPHVKYRYSVGGKEYVNEQVYTVGKIGYPRDKALRLVNDLPNPVPVHYNPQDPSESYLLANPRWVGWLILAMGAVVFPCGLLQLCVELTRLYMP